jgi:hypothetical protein
LRKKLGYASAFSSGQLLEASLATSSIFNKDNGLHLMGYKIQLKDKTKDKSTVIDNMSIYGSRILLLECKNYLSITGEIDDQFWKAKGRKQTYRILNPLKQNAYHRKLVTLHMQANGILQNEYQLSDYVVVSDTCELDMSKTARKFVIYESELKTLKKSLSDEFSQVNPKLTQVIRGNLR